MTTAGVLPDAYFAPACDPEAARVVRERAADRVRPLLDDPGLLGAARGGYQAPAAVLEAIRAEVDAYNHSAVMLNLPRLPIGDGIERWLADALIFYGPLTPALRDPLVEEAFADGPDRISLVRAGRHVLTTLAFDDEAHLLAVAKKLAADAGRRLDEASPMVEARLPDGSRLHAVIAPVAHPWPYVTIRRFPARLRRLAALAADDEIFLGEAAAAFLVHAVRGGASTLFSGPTGSGKTTLLNAALAELGGRTVVIEETAELKIDEIPFTVGLQGRPPNVEGVGEIPLRPLVRAALRMRPDRIVVGESRGAEAFDLLQAMNTGHPGSLSTLHANGPRDALERLVTMAAQAGEHLSDGTLRRMVAQTIGLVVQLELAHGQRRVTEVWELAGLEGDQLLGHAIFARDAAGRLRRTGLPSRWEGEASLARTNGHAEVSV